MGHQVSADELLAKWSLGPEDMTLLDGLADPGRLGLAIQLAFWRRHSRWAGHLCMIHDLCNAATIAYSSFAVL